MAKNIQIRPNPATGKPYILFVNTPAPPIKLVVEDDGTISFSSSTQSQSLQITNNSINLKGYGKFNGNINVGGNPAINAVAKTWVGSSTGVKGPTGPGGDKGDEFIGPGGPHRRFSARTYW
jgi:hypothetical protein